MNRKSSFINILEEYNWKLGTEFLNTVRSHYTCTIPVWIQVHVLVNNRREKTAVSTEPCLSTHRVCALEWDKKMKLLFPHFLCVKITYFSDWRWFKVVSTIRDVPLLRWLQNVTLAWDLPVYISFKENTLLAKIFICMIKALVLKFVSKTSQRYYRML